ncbi:MAG: hypothetical protein SNJ49_14805 [Chloracidobacterium sp.]
MNRNYKDNILARTKAGSEGRPGDYYEVIYLSAARYDDGLCEAQAKWSRGSNQVCLEEHFSQSSRGRGDNIAEAIDAMAQDVLEWNTRISVAERRAALRDLRYEAEDALAGLSE